MKLDKLSVNIQHQTLTPGYFYNKIEFHCKKKTATTNKAKLIDQNQAHLYTPSILQKANKNSNHSIKFYDIVCEQTRNTQS